jgi:hypothetical protein
MGVVGVNVKLVCKELLAVKNSVIAVADASFDVRDDRLQAVSMVRRIE